MSAATITATNTAATAIAQAIRASGTLVRVEPKALLAILARSPEPLVVHAYSNHWWARYHQYMTSYKGLAFIANSDEPLPLPITAEVIEAQSLYIPG